ncbi:hypothetical protein AVEN_257629-1 [Araneus ventricosus]|uniref:RNase H type-1 domain-containing protein n=1 Tax=Araneus ventricosus TaxID=182803 RepID=A0A4Y2E4T6_ARAVE|nr:hypothetical protein AVEN_257629-1 [Araneus ventricosus]
MNTYEDSRNEILKYHFPYISDDLIIESRSLNTDNQCKFAIEEIQTVIDSLEDNKSPDGSKINDRVGCAMVVFEDGNEKEHEIWRLNNETTVFIAVMVAIREAVNYSKRRQIVKANIISDSRSALVSIEFLKENRKFILDIKNSLQDTNSNVLLWWTKAHAGNKGNERADYFLRKPLRNKKSIFIFARPNNRGKRNIRLNWQILWDHSSKGKQVKKLFDKVDEKRVLDDFYLNQIISGHGTFKTYQNRFFVQSPWCFCGKDEGTVEQTILKCMKDMRDTYF